MYKKIINFGHYLKEHYATKWKKKKEKSSRSSKTKKYHPKSLNPIKDHHPNSNIMKKVEGCQFGKEYMITTKRLGEGSSGSVYLGYELESGNKVACKIMTKKYFHLYENEKHCAWLLRGNRKIC